MYRASNAITSTIPIVGEPHGHDRRDDLQSAAESRHVVNDGSGNGLGRVAFALWSLPDQGVLGGVRNETVAAPDVDPHGIAAEDLPSEEAVELVATLTAHRPVEICPPKDRGEHALGDEAGLERCHALGASSFVRAYEPQDHGAGEHERDRRGDRETEDQTRLGGPRRAQGTFALAERRRALSPARDSCRSFFQGPHDALLPARTIGTSARSLKGPSESRLRLPTPYESGPTGMHLTNAWPLYLLV
jgi:hypothetical protein